METSTHVPVPPGFRFHPTDEELVDYYLRRKINSMKIDLDIIKEVDLYKIEPWDLQELCNLGDKEQNEWYFFSHKDKKYPTGTRTNRATVAGFWKATGRDKAIYSKRELVGMRKTLVFYKGRAPNGQKSDWIMHEYRLETDENGAPQEEGWAVCRVFKKKSTTMRKINEHESTYWYEDRASLISDTNSPNQGCQSNNIVFNNQPLHCRNGIDLPFHIPPLFENSKIFPSTSHGVSSSTYNNNDNNVLLQENNNAMQQQLNDDNDNAQMALIGSNTLLDEGGFDELTDWRVLDKFVASQLTQEDVSKGRNNHEYSSIVAASSESLPVALLSDHLQKKDLAQENTYTSTSRCHIDAYRVQKPSL